jgi:hypothetical protein
MNGGYRRVGGTYRRNLKGDRWTMHRMEIYRLWVEYLKRCERPDSKIYKAWGDYRTTPFREWWQKNWVELFAEPKTTKKPVDGVTQSKAKFRTTEGKELKRRALRYYLRAYDLHQKGYKALEIAQKLWDERVEMRKRNPKRAIALAIELDLRDFHRNYNPKASLRSPESAQRLVYRWVQKAKKIIANVEKGEFPGKI